MAVRYHFFFDEYLMDMMDPEDDGSVRINRRRIRDAENPFDMPVGEFRHHYRFSQDTCLDIINMLRPFAIEAIRKTRIPLETRFLIALNFYATGSYQRSFGGHYHHPIGQSTASYTVREITDLLVNNLMAIEILFPTTAQEVQKAKARFFATQNMAGVIFLVDGTKLTIFPTPKDHPVYPERLYVDRSGKHSINCQLTCDADKFITSINCKYPGSTHDSFIWANSSIKQHMESKYNDGERNTFGLGDSGYPMSPYLLTPYPENANLTESQQAYNRRHKRCRSLVEQTIGAWKNTFRCTGRFRVMHYDPVRAGRMAIATAILYNIGRKRNLIEDVDLEEEDDDDDNLPAPEAALAEMNVNENTREAGRRERDIYTQRYFG